MGDDSTPVKWPGGRRFAFTAVDDTDWCTVRTVKPVYDLLADLGIYTTKSVWVFDGVDSTGYQGQTCEEPKYRDWTLSLQRAGFEISLHNAAPITSHRERTRRALDHFASLYGARNIIHCNHRLCEENIYWGEARVTGARRKFYNWCTRQRRVNHFRGHLEGDPLFWGDLCRERITYVRNFVFDEINTLKACPEMPYHDPGKPFVNFWFASAEGGSLKRFLRTYTLQNIDRLVEEGGLSVAYVHFGADFACDGKINPEFRRRMEYLASKGGWFAPASTVLDHLRANGTREQRTIVPARLRRLETRWLARKLGEMYTRPRMLAAAAFC